jgi:hypothetical protein
VRRLPYVPFSKPAEAPSSTRIGPAGVARGLAKSTLDPLRPSASTPPNVCEPPAGGLNVTAPGPTVVMVWDPPV